MNFNYQKAYCTQAVPAYQALSTTQIEVHNKLSVLVADLQQGIDLAIPLNDDITAELAKLTTDEIAELARTSYFLGHWQPGLLPTLIQSSWKVSNCCDQVLRQRLNPPRKIEIHEGKLRVTFSSRDFWLWEEFGLATDKNIELFKTCGLPFGEETLHDSAKQLASLCGDLWPDVDTLEDNALYIEFLALQQEQEKQQIIKRFESKIKDLEKGKKNAQKEIDFLLACNAVGVPVDNVIYYAHTETFCFGWRKKLSFKEEQDIKSKLGTIADRYNVELKTV